MQRSYLHQEALAQTGVVCSFFGQEMVIYPLTLRAINDLNRRVRDRYFDQYEKSVALLPEAERAPFWERVVEKSEKLNFQTGEGFQLFFSNVDLMVQLVRELCRNHPQWSEEEIQQQVLKSSCPTAEDKILAFAERLAEMQMLVYREAPSLPSLNIPNKQARYEWTTDERATQTYTLLFTKYHWTPEVVSNLTEYQVLWFAYYSLPDERERVEDLYKTVSHSDRGSGKGPDVPYQPNTLHFNSPAEWDAYKAEHGIG